MACATKEFYDWDEEEKERNEKHKGGAAERKNDVMDAIWSSKRTFGATGQS